MSTHTHSIRRNPLAIALLSWLLPGAGYLALGQRARGLTVGITILTLFFGGLLIAGIRVIDVPGYNKQGQRVELDNRGLVIDRTRDTRTPGQWALAARPVSEIANKPWFVGQILVGPLSLGAAKLSLSVAAQGAPLTKARLGEIGILYTAVAGMLNLLAIIDSAYRASHPPEETTSPASPERTVAA